jgi:acetylornithine deacetylase/succinyl-diaminopimelate desuccinylase-like protein
MISRYLVLSLSLMLAPAIFAQSPSEAAHQYTAAHRDELIEEYSKLLAIPNVAADPANLQRNADTLVAMLKQRGADARLFSVAGAPPVVYGEIKTLGAKHTVLFYAHYDGQPVTPSEWTVTPPFTPLLKEVHGEQRIYARGAGDDKAAIFAQLAALDALRSAKIPLRANIRFSLGWGRRGWLAAS